MATLSFCIVAYDEDEVFEKSLQSIVDVADEIMIVFERGTSQKTQDIARKYTQHISFDALVDWSTSFNHVCSLATGDYLINWDADFVLRESSKSAILDLKSKGFDGHDSIVIHWNIEFADGYKVPLKWVNRKLIHKRDAYVFSHPLHPRHVYQLDRPESIGYYPNIEVDHYNTFGGRKPRYERFLSIMSELVRDNPDDVESLFYYGEELIFARDFDTAFDVWSRYLDRPDMDPLGRVVFGVNHYCHVCIELKKFGEALAMIQKWNRYTNVSATYDLIKCDVFLANSLIDEAVQGYESFIARYSDTIDHNSVDLTDYYRLTVYPYYILAKIYKLLGKSKKSHVYGTKARDNNHDPARNNEIEQLTSSQ
jgi:glycosyltransferase involved in cell wall biosynthesis